MIQVGLDYTLVIQIVQFLLIVFFANILILKPIKSTIDARDAKINSLMESAESQLEKVEASKRAYDSKLVSVRNEIAEYQRKVKAEAGEKVDAIISSAKADVSKSTEEARAELEKAVAEAKTQLHKEVKDISEMIYKTISGSAA